MIEASEAVTLPRAAVVRAEQASPIARPLLAYPRMRGFIVRF